MSLISRAVSKKLYLPLKWRLEKWAKAYSVSYPHPSVLQAKRAELDAQRLAALQAGSAQEAAQCRGGMDAIDFMLNYADET